MDNVGYPMYLETCFIILVNLTLKYVIAFTEAQYPAQVYHEDYEG